MRQILSRLTAVKFFLTAVAHFFWLKLMNRIFGIQKASTEISIFMKARAPQTGR